MVCVAREGVGHPYLRAGFALNHRSYGRGRKGGGEWWAVVDSNH